MKRLVLFVFTLLSFSVAYAQPGSLSQSVYKSRVNDTTSVAFTDAITAAVSAGYGYWFWNNQASTPHLDIYTDAGVEHVFTFAGGGGGGTPGGADTQVQYNDGGSFNGEADMAYNETTNTLTVDVVSVDAEAYDATGWNGDTSVPQKDAVRDKIETLELISNTSSSLTDGAAVTITGTKHTLTSDEATITWTLSQAGDFQTTDIILNATTTTWTFPANTLCVYEGVASGDNTAVLSGTSGDHYILSIYKDGTNYRVVIKNFGQ